MGPSPTPNFKSTPTNNNNNAPQAYIIQRTQTTVIPVRPPTYSQSQLPTLKRKLPVLPSSNENNFKLESPPPNKIKRENSKTPKAKKPKEKKFACDHVHKET